MDEQNGTGSWGESVPGGGVLVDGVNGQILGRCEICLAPAIAERCKDCLKGIEPRAEFVAVRRMYVS